MQTLTTDSPRELAEARLDSAVLAWHAQERYGRQDGSGARRDLDQYQAEITRWLLKLKQASDADYAAASLIEAKTQAEQIYGPVQMKTVQLRRPTEVPPRDWEK